MNIITIIPTGIGCEIGGHAGDANPVIKLLASVSDNLITHPNAVNASDINEMPENVMYVEGSILDRFLQGDVGLEPLRYGNNKILLVANKPIKNETINSVNAARATIGADIEIVELNVPLQMKAFMDGDVASGEVIGWRELVEQVEQYEFDALAIHTVIDVDDRQITLDYLNDKQGVNPWGAVEAKASRLVATELMYKQVAHAPVENEAFKGFNEIVDPRKAAEIVSTSYLHCVLKGLHRAPIVRRHGGMQNQDINFMVSPWGCWGEPHNACMDFDIPIIMVKENKTVLDKLIPKEFNDLVICVDNYFEAVGVIQTHRAGVSIESIRRPLKKAVIYK